MKPKTYVRSMDGWWRQRPAYRGYLLREASCIFVIAYALVLLTGLASLAQGREAFDAWRALLATPAAIAFHLLTLVAMVYHAWTWFKVMPKTLPFIRLRGRRVADTTIVRSGVAAALLASVLIFALAWVGLR